MRATLITLVAASLLPPPASHAQDLKQQRQELERIKQERADLEKQMEGLQSTAHDLTEELTNIERRADATSRIMKTLDRQLIAISTELETATTNTAVAEAELSRKKAILRRRLVDIYKRGPLYTEEVLLSAPSFGELVARYKYLHQLALRDRMLVRQVEQLRNQVAREHDRLIDLQRNLRDSREDKQLEDQRLRALEQQQRVQLARIQTETRQTQNRILRMRATETQLTGTIAALELERRRAVANRPSNNRAISSISTNDYGRLDWPVEGALVYTFGRAVQSNNTAIRWNGVGIRATIGSPVRSVAPGRVVSVRQLGTYGLTVIVEHGGGDYSIYGSLSRADVREGQAVAKGGIIGGVGISDPELPPHLHFEIRHGGPAVDPVIWLRQR